LRTRSGNSSSIGSGAAEKERNLIGERTRTALAHKRSKGERLGGLPLGLDAEAGADRAVEDELSRYA
jgi:DNA invertase Pin-like site-specific DNA recombinase